MSKMNKFALIALIMVSSAVITSKIEHCKKYKSIPEPLTCDECETGFFVDGEGQKCSQCAPNCMDCQNSSACLTCMNKFFLTNGECQKCSTGCTFCTSIKKCQKCEEGREMVNNRCFTKTQKMYTHWVIYGLLILTGIFIIQYILKYALGKKPAEDKEDNYAKLQEAKLNDSAVSN